MKKILNEYEGVPDYEKFNEIIYLRIFDKYNLQIEFNNQRIENLEKIVQFHYESNLQAGLVSNYQMYLIKQNKLMQCCADDYEQIEIVEIIPPISDYQLRIKKIHENCFFNFLINVIICLILKPENVQIGTFMGQFKSLFKYLEKKK